MVDAELARSKQRCVQLESAVKARDAEITKLTRAMDQSEVSERCQGRVQIRVGMMVCPLPPSPAGSSP